MKKLAAVIFFAVFAALLGWWMSLPSKPSTVTVPENSSAVQIADALRRADAISSKTVFRAAVKLMGKSRQLKAGTYLIPARTSVFGVIRMISSGRGAYQRVTIPEGFTAADIAEALAARGIVDKERFMALVKEKQLEGYLFPDTYYFDKNLPERTVVDKMRREFERNFTPKMRERAEELKLGEKKAVTLASIIEKEAVLKSEKALIAGVFYNRLKKGWFLESCATVQYALGGHKPVLTYKDIKVNSPYNTYKFYGLPPGPICSPGRDSLEAALYPEQTEDMFFVAASSGSHIFSRYFSEHIKSKIKSKRNKKRQQSK
jgi:UPF0755 protein